MNIAQILDNLAWRPGIGDPSAAGWLTVFAYLATSALAFYFFLRGGRPDKGARRSIWLLLAVLLLVLGINKQLDLQTLLTEIGREIAKTQGWYAERRVVQRVLIAVLAAGGALVTLRLGWIWREVVGRFRLVFAGLAILLIFVLVRAVSLHAVDVLIQRSFLGLRANVIIELGSLLLIGAGLEGGLRRLPAAGERSPQPVFMPLLAAGLSGAAGAVLFWQLLAGGSAARPAAFENTGTPYAHPAGLEESLVLARPLPFRAAFDGTPSTPRPWRPVEGWDVTVYTRDWESWETMDPLDAAYGPDCAPPPAVHPVESFDEAVFQCGGRVMTALNGRGYAAAYLTPAHMIDLSPLASGGEGVLRFDLSTERRSGRDWIEVWITPFAGNLQLAGQPWLPALNGLPAEGFHFWMQFDGWRFQGAQIVEGESRPLAGEWFTLAEALPQTTGEELVTLELRLASGEIRFGLPEADRWWVVDGPAAPFDWAAAVVQLSHHSFEPRKDCPDCAPNTWQWDNVAIEPAVPFTILPAFERYVNRGSGPAVTFPAASPPGSYLRFFAFGEEVQVSFDQGQSWQPALRQSYAREDIGYQSYWTPLPPELDTVHIRARDWQGQPWQVRDPAIWAIGGRRMADS